MSYFVRKKPTFLPTPHQEIHGARDSTSVRCQSVSQNESVESPTKSKTKEPTQPNTQDNAVQDGQNHTKFNIADALDKGVSATHYSQCREHPQDGADKYGGHFVHSCIFGEQHKEFFSEEEEQKIVFSENDFIEKKGEGFCVPTTSESPAQAVAVVSGVVAVASSSRARRPPLRSTSVPAIG